MTLTEELNILSQELLEEFGFLVKLIKKTKEEFDIEEGETIFLEEEKEAYAFFLEDKQGIYKNFSIDNNYSVILIKSLEEINLNDLIKIDNKYFSILNIINVKSKNFNLINKLVIGEINK